MDFPENSEFEDLETTENIDYNESFTNPITGEGDTESDEGDENESDEEGVTANIIDSPGGSEKLYQPIVPNEYLPDRDATYKSLDEAIEMYTKYADKAGFDVRLNTTTRFADDNSIRIRYVVCSKTGKIPNRSMNSLDTSYSKKQRNSSFKVTNCKALIKFERIDRTENFKIRSFQDLHNHPLDTIEDRKHSKRARKLKYSDKNFIFKASTANLGATKAYNLMSTLEGGYENMDPEASDYKNFKLKYSNLLADRDAQLIVNKMLERENELTNFTFEFDMIDSELSCMFWADETNKAYYKEFGDVISFDATFRSNKYGMRFVPFTAIDHHKKSVTIGAGLICNESTEMYTWLLESFLKAHGKQPAIVLTDQHAAVFQAVKDVFPESRLRWCMWHIMEKLPKKVDPKILQTTDFRKRFKDIVWEERSNPEECEEEWMSLINEYNLGKKRWFRDMYRRRRYWLPAYFKDEPMHGLMKTTSRSESSNSFFKKFTNHAHFLYDFMINFDVAMEKQRHRQRDLDYATKKANYDFTLKTGLERHASKVYTRSMFLNVRKELQEGAWNCSIDSMETVDGLQCLSISHVNSTSQAVTKCKVELKMPEIDIKCTCQYFTRDGILCRHIFRVLINNRIEEIPEKYILRRWKKDVISSHLLVAKHGCVETQGETFKLINEAYSNIETCVDLVKDNKEELKSFVENTKSILKDMEKRCTKKNGKLNDTELIKNMLGIRNIPDTLDIRVPRIQENAGVGTKKRMISVSEKARSSKKKKSRRCKGCGEFAGHNWRTCEVRIARDETNKIND